LNRIVLVARREYRQITATRGFWVMLLFIPLAIIVTQIAAQLIKPPASIAYVIVDASGQYARTVQRRIELDYQRTVPRPIVLAQVPGTVPTSQGSERFGAAIAPLLQGEIATPDGKRPLALAIYIPKDFGARGIPVRIWTDGRPHDALIETVRSALTNALRFQVLRTSGLSDAVFTRIAALNAPLAITTPSQGSGRQLVIVRSFLPLALVYILLMTVLVTGSLMLQGAIEERSNKLLEAVLACISPNALMYGKLLGLGAIGLTTVVVWTATAVGAGLATHGVVADFLRSSFASLDRPWIAVALIFYFLAGYLVVSMIYLAIGSLRPIFCLL